MWMSKDVSKTLGIEKTTCLHNDIVIMLLLERIPLFGRARKIPKATIINKQRDTIMHLVNFLCINNVPQDMKGWATLLACTHNGFMMKGTLKFRAIFQ